MQEKGRNRSNPHFEHLMRAVPLLQSPQTRNAEAARAMRGRRNLPKVGRSAARRQPGTQGSGGGRACARDRVSGDGRGGGRMVGQAQRPQWQHEEKRGNGHTDLMGSPGAGLPAEPPSVAQHSRPGSGFGQPIWEMRCQFPRNGRCPGTGRRLRYHLRSSGSPCDCRRSPEAVFSRRWVTPFSASVSSFVPAW